MTRYYYTCPIKALYMIKEFGVEFEIVNEDEEDEDEAQPYFDFRCWEIESPETINTLLDVLDCGGRIYVKYESAYIFEPKEGDIGFCNLDNIYGGTRIAPISFDLGGWKATGHMWEVAKNPKIIFRDNKQFFMPEVEND